MCSTSARKILIVAAGVTLGLIGYETARLVWLVALEIMWEATRRVG